VTSAQSSIYLARHGRTAYNREGRFQGHLPVPLDDTGRAQAAELAERAAAHAFAALWCSPLARARDTAEIVSRRIGLPAREDARLAETDAGEWTDRTFAEVRLEEPERFAAFVGGDPDFSFPGGESFVQHGARVAAALVEVERGPLPALVVCHGVVIRIALVLRAGNRGPLADPVPNGALIELPPARPRAGG
jgi:broad specificity phosphatase PhoE